MQVYAGILSTISIHMAYLVYYGVTIVAYIEDCKTLDIYSKLLVQIYNINQDLDRSFILS